MFIFQKLYSINLKCLSKQCNNNIFFTNKAKSNCYICTMKNMRILYLLLILFPISVFAEDVDSTQTKKEEIIIIPDSLLSTPLSIHGRLSQHGVIPSYIINKKDLQTILYREFSDIIYNQIPVYPLSLGNYGHFNSFSYLGLMPNNVDYNYNGRSVLDKNFLSLNPNQISHEGIENIEIYEGSDAVIMSSNGSNLLINSQEIIHNTENPYTRLWFSQAGFGTLSSDGTYSVNFKPNWNFTFGYKGQTSRGQFENDDISLWNIRLNLRWNPSDRTSISLSDNFSNHKIGVNGGMNENTSVDGAGTLFLYSPIYASEHLSEFLERNYRHDLNLNMTSILDKDSTSIFSGGVYFSDVLWRFEAPMDERIDTNSREIQEYRLDNVGAYSKYSFKYLDYIKLNLGGDISYSSIPESDAWQKFNNMEYSVFGLANIFLSDKLTLSGGLRQAYIYENINLSFGSKLKYDFDDSLSSAFIDFSYTEQSPSLAQGLSLDKSDITSFLAAYSLYSESFFLSTKASYRIINSPIYSRALWRNENIYSSESFNGENKNILSANLTTGISFSPDIMGDVDKLSFSTSLNYNKDDSDYKTIPDFLIKISTKYNFTIGRSKLFSGVNLTFIPPFTGLRFIPQQRVYAFLNTPTETSFKFNGIDIFVILKLGTAYVKIAMDNVMGQNYYYVPYYPAFQRNFNLSFAWTFLE